MQHAILQDETPKKKAPTLFFGVEARKITTKKIKNDVRKINTKRKV